MTSKGHFLLFMGLFSMLTVPPKLISGEGYVDVTVAPAPDHYVRYTSGNVIYVEGLVDGRWVGRYWTADGRINVPYELYADDAFRIEVNHLSLSRGWKWVESHEAQNTLAGRRH